MIRFAVLNENLFKWLYESAMSARQAHRTSDLADTMLEEAGKVSSLLHEANPSAQIHIEKITPEFFDPIWSGATSCLILKNDHSYKVGDLINLKEWSCLNKDWKENDGYSERSVMHYITHIVHLQRDDAFLISLGHGVKSIFVKPKLPFPFSDVR